MTLICQRCEIFETQQLVQKIMNICCQTDHFLCKPSEIKFDIQINLKIAN